LADVLKRPVKKLLLAVELILEQGLAQGLLDFAPAPTNRRSSTTGRQPRWHKWKARLVPAMPAPMMIAS